MVTGTKFPRFPIQKTRGLPARKFEPATTFPSRATSATGRYGNHIISAHPEPANQLAAALRKPFAREAEGPAPVIPKADRERRQIFPGAVTQRLKKLIAAIEPVRGVAKNPSQRNVAIVAMQQLHRRTE